MSEEIPFIRPVSSIEAFRFLVFFYIFFPELLLHPGGNTSCYKLKMAGHGGVVKAQRLELHLTRAHVKSLKTYV